MQHVFLQTHFEPIVYLKINLSSDEQSTEQKNCHAYDLISLQLEAR